MMGAFDDPRSLIEHARDHISVATDLVNTYVKSQRAHRVVNFDPLTCQDIYCLRVEGPEFPAKIALVVKDAVSGLREALDHAVYASAVVLNGGAPNNTAFPFALDADAVDKRLNKLTGNPVEIRPLLRSFNPFEGGNKLLWALNKIRNPNTHRFVVPSSPKAHFGGMGISQAVFAGNCQIGYSRWDPQTKEVEYMRLQHGSYANHTVDIEIQVVFDSVGVMSGLEVMATLSEMASEVERVVGAISEKTALILAARTGSGSPE